MRKIISICLILTILLSGMDISVSYADEYSVSILSKDTTKSGEGGSAVSGTDWYRAGMTSFPYWNTAFEMTKGSWGRYLVTAPATGVYAVSVRVGNNHTDSIVAIETEAGFGTYYTVPKNDDLWGVHYNAGYTYLEEGENIVVVRNDGPGNNIFHSMTFTKADDSYSEYLGTKNIIINAATDHVKTGTNGIDYYANHNGKTTPVITDYGIETTKNEMTKYVISVPISGVYSISVTAGVSAENAGLTVETDGYVTDVSLTPYPGSVTSIKEFTDKGYIYLKAGENTLWVRNTFGAWYFLKTITLKKVDDDRLGQNRLYIPAENFTNTGNINSTITGRACYNTVYWASGETLNYNIEVLKDGYYDLSVIGAIRNNFKPTIVIDGVAQEIIDSDTNGYVAGFADDNTINTKVLSGDIYLTKGTHNVSINLVDANKTVWVHGFEFTGYSEEKSALIAFNAAKNEADIKTALLRYADVLGINPETDFGNTICPEYSCVGLIGTYETLDEIIYIYNKIKQNPLVQYTQNKNSLDATIKLVDSIESGDKVILAAYKGDRLAAVASGVASGDTVTLTLDNYVKEDGDTFKIFVWDSVTGMKPLELRAHSADVYRNFYVSTNGNDENLGIKNYPFKTLTRALEEVAKINDDMTGAIVVNVEGGVYDFTTTVNITEEHSGKNGFDVIIKGIDEDNKPIFNGGEKINKWTKLSGSSIYYADIKNPNTRNLYINDCPATLARSKYIYRAAAPIVPQTPENKYHVTDGISISKANFPSSLKNEADLTLVYNNLWANQRVLVDNVVYDDRNVNLYMKQPFYNGASFWLNTSTSTHFDKYFYLENALSLLDEPGEFYVHKKSKRVYYYAYPEEDMTTADAYIGVSDKILNLSGTDKNNKLENFIVDSVEFKYGTNNNVNTYGAVFHQTDNVRTGTTSYYKNEMMKSQISVNNADGVIIRNCDFSCLGSNALNLDEAVTNSRVTGNSFSDISGTGIVVGSFLHGNSMSEDKERCSYIEIDNNVLRRCAQEYLGLCAINAYYVNNTNIHHNDIKDMPYSGITLGWGWGGSGDVAECRNNTISHNRIENVMQVMKDGAHIYTLGAMENTKINDNYLITSGYSAGGIYLDEGSAHITVENNVVEKCSTWLNARSGVGIADITILNNFSDVSDPIYDKSAVTLSGTTVVSDANWTGQAKNIVDAAGLSDDRSISDIDFYPEWRKMRMNDVAENEFAKADINNVWISATSYTRASKENPSIYADGSIGNVAPGDWFEYTLNIPEDGNYKITAAGAAQTLTAVPKIKLYLQNEIGLSEAATAELPTYSDIMFIGGIADLGTHKLSAGTKKLRIKIADYYIIYRGFKLENVDIAAVNDANYDDGQ